MITKYFIHILYSYIILSLTLLTSELIYEKFCKRNDNFYKAGGHVDHNVELSSGQDSKQGGHWPLTAPYFEPCDNVYDGAI